MLKGFKEFISCAKSRNCLTFYLGQSLWLLIGRRLRNIPMLLVLLLLFGLMAFETDTVLGAPYLFWHDSWVIFLMSLMAVGILLEEWTFVAILLDTDENNPINSQDPPRSISLISAVKKYLASLPTRDQPDRSNDPDKDSDNDSNSQSDTDGDPTRFASSLPDSDDPSPVGHRVSDAAVFGIVRKIHTIGTYGLIFGFSVAAALVFQAFNEHLLTSIRWDRWGLIPAVLYSAIPITAAYLMFWIRRLILKFALPLTDLCETMRSGMKHLLLGWLGDWMFAETTDRTKTFHKFHVIAFWKNFLAIGLMLLVTIGFWWRGSSGLIPSVGLIVCIVLSAAVGIYGWMIYQRRRLRYEAVMGALIFIALAFIMFGKNVPKQVRLGEYEIPEDPVAALNQVKDQVLLQRSARVQWIRSLNMSSGQNAGSPGPGNPENTVAPPENLTEEKLLTNWKKLASQSQPDQKPILVLISNSGGGIKAQVWSTTVLNAIEQHLSHSRTSSQPIHFSRNVRLISGASGGMVGAGYWVATLADKPEVDAESGLVTYHFDRDSIRDSELKAVSADQMFYQMSRDCLSPVARQGFYNDLLGLPRRLFGSKLPTRGEALEEAFVQYGPAFNKSFSQLKAGEDAGWRPTLVYTPSVANDGRRLLICNQPLEYLFYSNLDRFNPSPQPTDENLTRKDRESLATYSWRLNYKPPNQQPVDDASVRFSESQYLKLATVARLSGNFPVVIDSPYLPFENPRNKMRIMDAGYIDNHGLYPLASWIEANRVWIKKHTAGLLVIEISAATLPRTESKSQADLDKGTSPPQNPISPELIGFVNSSFNKTLFHSDRLLANSIEFLNNEADPDFFKLMAFEYDGDASLSWYLSNVEKLSLIYRFLSDEQARNLVRDGQSAAFAKEVVDQAIHQNLFQLEHLGLIRELSRSARRFGTDRFRKAELARRNMGQNLKDLKDWWQKRSTPR